ncbi:hypothetical protein CMI37_17395 [Candidatus Pacearchaeota archaeon]|nr:hypothetical protein [Candidatus Pacearchaeota archaeon]|tara:strand:- start:5424 stop:6302 length:879 start_codon:yes stop_codon:yes gene_type:complete
MENFQIPIGRVKEIAREVDQGTPQIALPTLEEISWAFPVRGLTITGNVGGRYLNAQEVRAYEDTLLFHNYLNTLSFLLQGSLAKGVKAFTRRRLVLPTHQGDPEDLCDGTHLHFGYIKRKEDTISQRLSNLKPFANMPDEWARGYFWENIPNDLRKAVLRCETVLRGEGGAYASEENTRRYIESLNKALKQGKDYLEVIARNREENVRYPQMIKSDISELVEGNYFQVVVPDKEARLYEGICCNSDKNKVGYKFWTTIPYNGEVCQKEGDVFYTSRNEKIPCWKLIPPQNHP